MTEASDRDPQPPTQPEPGNPSSDDLDVEGPNESAPGHEPSDDDDGEQAADRSSRPAE